ncbi:MAG: LD-carboxypeptidase [Deltaproteobacteria bacterium]|nr:MAG: LD-carboxypeptidase [Deltaproteobacteria bacterium]
MILDLAAGPRIAVVAPCHAFNEDRYQAGVRWLRERGAEVVEAEDLRARHRYFAGSDEHRLKTLVHALTAPDIDAVWAARGGSGITRLLRRIPWTSLPPRPVLGFSDLTPLLDQLALRGAAAIHGPVLHSIGQTSADSLSHLEALLRGGALDPLPGHPLIPGRAEGPIVGGNLCLIASTCGTPYQLDASGAILVLEEVGEPPYKVDRLFQQLTDAGVFRGVAGVALGSFTGCGAPADAPWSLHEIFEEHLGGLNVPVLDEVPIGHGPDNHAFVVRHQAAIRDGALHLAR